MAIVPLTPISRVGILAKSNLRAAVTHLIEIGEWLRQRGITAVFESDTASLMPADDRRLVVDRSALAADVDMVLVLGGDGTLIGMADSIGTAGTGIPILGVNFGSLGFLTEVILPELYRSLEAAIAGRLQVEERLMLKATTTRDHAEFARAVAVNDVVITKTARSRMIDLSVYVGDEFVTRVKADGLIIATPTGSTAYALSASGPLLHPAMNALVLVPVAPQTLSNRPIVIPDSGVLSMTLTAIGRVETGASVHFDMQTWSDLQPGDRITVRRAPYTARFLHPEGYSFFSTLRHKLHWNLMPEATDNAD
jgi:NAD+ kinase